jgi:hypothetical protein
MSLLYSFSHMHTSNVSTAPVDCYCRPGICGIVGPALAEPRALIGRAMSVETDKAIKVPRTETPVIQKEAGAASCGRCLLR